MPNHTIKVRRLSPYSLDRAPNSEVWSEDSDVVTKQGLLGAQEAKLVSPNIKQRNTYQHPADTLRAPLVAAAAGSSSLQDSNKETSRKIAPVERREESPDMILETVNPPSPTVN